MENDLRMLYLMWGDFLDEINIQVEINKVKILFLGAITNIYDFLFLRKRIL